jgi:hypothetical protein
LNRKASIQTNNGPKSGTIDNFKDTFLSSFKKSMTVKDSPSPKSSTRETKNDKVSPAKINATINAKRQWK